MCENCDRLASEMVNISDSNIEISLKKEGLLIKVDDGEVICRSPTEAFAIYWYVRKALLQAADSDAAKLVETLEGLDGKYSVIHNEELN
jgi:hypothetical protein